MTEFAEKNMIRVVYEKDKDLYVWVNYKAHDQCYAKKLELLLLFELWLKSLNVQGTSGIAYDFLNTVNELDDFYMEPTKKGLVYYTQK